MTPFWIKSDHCALLLFVAEAETTKAGLFVVEVPTDDKGMVPVGSNPLDLFRLAIGQPDALHQWKNISDIASVHSASGCAISLLPTISFPYILHKAFGAD